MTNTARISITISKALLEDLKRRVPKGKLSGYLELAATEKLAQEQRSEALKVLLAAPPTHLDYPLEEYRKSDETRERHLGI